MDLHCQEEPLSIVPNHSLDTLKVEKNKLEGIDQFSRTKMFSQLLPPKPDKHAKTLTDQQMRCTKDSSERSSLPVAKKDQNAQKNTKIEKLIK